MTEAGSVVVQTAVEPHSEHRFPAPSSKEGCRKPVLGVCSGASLSVGGSTRIHALVILFEALPGEKSSCGRL